VRNISAGSGELTVLMCATSHFCHTFCLKDKMTNVCVPSSYIQSTPVSTIEAVDYVPYTPTIEVIVHLPIRLAKATAIEGKGLGGVFRKTITGLVAYFRFYEPCIVIYTYVIRTNKMHTFYLNILI
jgi:hypothetical protein